MHWVSSRQPHLGHPLLRVAAAAAMVLGTLFGTVAFAATVEIDLTAAPGEVELFPGAPTRVLQYTGVVTSGDPSTVQPIPGSYLGPIFRLDRGDRVKVRFVNQTGEPSIVHWHGLVVPDEMDGHPRFAVPDGAEYTYEFTVDNRAGTYWFHPHPDMLTGGQVYRGLAGLFLVSDAEEAALDLPRGEYDLPLVIQDRTFDLSNQFVYDTGGMMGGALGNRILVNGAVSAVQSVATRVYRLRLLNGSNSRIYKLAWEDGTPMTVLGTDDGLLAASVSRPYVTLAPGERVEVWADFRARSVGTELKLRSLAFTASGLGSGTLPNGAALDVTTFSFDRAESETLVLPASLTSISPFDPADAVNAGNPRSFAASFDGGNWLLNGREFEMTEVLPNEIVQLGDLEIWELTNVSSMMLMPHPLHVHAVQFQVYERTILPSQAGDYATLKDGYVDSGWKDTVLLFPGERVKLLMRFGPYPGLFNYHCHNLEHEDRGMMRNFRIEGDPAPTEEPVGRARRLELQRFESPLATGRADLRYRVDMPGAEVALEILDAQGRVIRIVDHGFRAAGEYAAPWDRRDASGHLCPAGLYWVRLSSDRDDLARKLVLLSR